MVYVGVSRVICIILRMHFRKLQKCFDNFRYAFLFPESVWRCLGSNGRGWLQYVIVWESLSMSQHEALQSLLEDILDEPRVSAEDRAILFAASLSCTKGFDWF